jgi:hypothetical protein
MNKENTWENNLSRRLIGVLKEESRAFELADTQAQNRASDRRDALIDELVGLGASGRDKMEALMSHELPLARASAAATVMRWAPERAVPVLEDLLRWAIAERGDRGQRSRTAAMILFDCKVLLSQHHRIQMHEVVPKVVGQGG